MKILALKALRLFDHVSQYLPSFGSFQPSKGWFSAYQQLEQGKIEGDVLYSSQEIGPEPEGSVTLTSGLSQARFQPWPAFWTMDNKALLLGRTALWRSSDEKFCLEAAYHTKDRRRLREDPVFARSWVGGAEYLPGAWTSIVSNWGDGKNYFHWLFDNLTRLLVREHLPEETRILIPADLPSFALDTLEMLGLRSMTKPISGKPLRPEKFYFCSPTAMTGVWNPAGFEWLRTKFSSFRSASSAGRPVFFTRRGVSRVPGGIDDIENLFRRCGFEIVECSQLSVAEQIATASQASAIAGVHGAAMSNLIWASAGTPVLEIFNKEYLNGCYEQIALQGLLPYNHTVIGECDVLHDVSTWSKSHRL